MVDASVVVPSIVLALIAIFALALIGIRYVKGTIQKREFIENITVDGAIERQNGRSLVVIDEGKKKREGNDSPTHAHNVDTEEYRFSGILPPVKSILEGGESSSFEDINKAFPVVVTEARDLEIDTGAVEDNNNDDGQNDDQDESIGLETAEDGRIVARRPRTFNSGSARKLYSAVGGLPILESGIKSGLLADRVLISRADFVASCDDEIRIYPGDYLSVFHEYDGGWLIGINWRNRQSGMFHEAVLCHEFAGSVVTSRAVPTRIKTVRPRGKTSVLNNPYGAATLPDKLPRSRNKAFYSTLGRNKRLDSDFIMQSPQAPDPSLKELINENMTILDKFLSSNDTVSASPPPKPPPRIVTKFISGISPAQQIPPGVSRATIAVDSGNSLLFTTPPVSPFSNVAACSTLTLPKKDSPKEASPHPPPPSRSELENMGFSKETLIGIMDTFDSYSTESFLRNDIYNAIATGRSSKILARESLPRPPHDDDTLVPLSSSGNQTAVASFSAEGSSMFPTYYLKKSPTPISPCKLSPPHVQSLKSERDAVYSTLGSAYSSKLRPTSIPRLSRTPSSTPSRVDVAIAPASADTISCGVSGDDPPYSYSDVDSAPLGSGFTASANSAPASYPSGSMKNFLSLMKRYNRDIPGITSSDVYSAPPYSENRSKHPIFIRASVNGYLPQGLHPENSFHAARTTASVIEM